jgi:RES domain-containing protein
MKLWRIGSTGPGWAPNDLTGAGAATSPGRWNKPGELVIYAAPLLPTAVLETAAHIDDGGLPLNKYIIEIDVPDTIWNKRAVMAVDTLEGGWDAIPHGRVSIEIGSAWYSAGVHAIAEFPSAIIPEVSIVLINAQHPDTANITAATGRKFQYNMLFRAK